MLLLNTFPKHYVLALVQAKEYSILLEGMTSPYLASKKINCCLSFPLWASHLYALLFCKTLENIKPRNKVTSTSIFLLQAISQCRRALISFSLPGWFGEIKLSSCFWAVFMIRELEKVVLFFYSGPYLEEGPGHATLFPFNDENTLSPKDREFFELSTWFKARIAGKCYCCCCCCCFVFFWGGRLLASSESATPIPCFFCFLEFVFIYAHVTVICKKRYNFSSVFLCISSRVVSVLLSSALLCRLVLSLLRF